jgi:hypothetical protein
MRTAAILAALAVLGAYQLQRVRWDISDAISLTVYEFGLHNYFYGTVGDALCERDMSAESRASVERRLECLQAQLTRIENRQRWF